MRHYLFLYQAIKHGKTQIFLLYFPIFYLLRYLNNNMETKPRFKPNPSLKLMDQVREVLRYYHYYRTEQAYCQ